MKKLLLFGAFLGSLFTVNAQNSCATASPLTTGTIVVGDIDGSLTGAYSASCWENAGTAAEWYVYTAPSTGSLRINANLGANDGETYSDDTRMAAYTGTCGSLTCYAISDDVSLTNYLSDMTITVIGGSTYYIAFDDRWSELGFEAQVTFTPIVPATLPYTQNFDSTTSPMDGWISSPSEWNVTTGTATVPAQSGTSFAFTNTATTPVSRWMFSRAISLQANVPVNITFYTWYLGDATDTASLALTVGNDFTSASQSTTLGTYTMTGGETFVQRTATFTPTTAGNYVFGFHNNSPAASGEWSLLVDTISFTAGTAGTGDFLASQFSVYPNPASNVINIINAEGALVNSVEILDINGRTVKSVKFTGVAEAQVNVAELSAGMYLMNVASDKGTITKKIVKQ